MQRSLYTHRIEVDLQSMPALGARSEAAQLSVPGVILPVIDDGTPTTKAGLGGL